MISVSASAQVGVPPDLINPCDPLEGNCDPSDPNNPLFYVNPLADAVTAMQEDLLANWAQPGLCATVEYSVPTIIEDGDSMSASGTVAVYSLADGNRIRVGTTDITTNPTNGALSLIIDVTDEAIQFGGVNQIWVLTQTVSASEGSVYVFGTIEVTQIIPYSNTTYTGGWIYTPGVGPVANPSSDPGFHDAVATMYGCDTGTVAAGGILGTVFSALVNVLADAINYIRDWFRPYTPPTSCSGPVITGSCNSSDISCQDNISDIALQITNIPSVSTAFKKCMKGRLGCGGSSFPRLRISCDDSTNCGPCAPLTLCQQLGCDGCNIGGTSLWYCADPASNSCRCINILFHESSHSCGALDLQNGAAYDSYRIGGWFEAEFKEQGGLDSQCRSGSRGFLGDTVSETNN